MTEPEFLKLLSRYKNSRLSPREEAEFAEAAASGQFDELVQHDVLRALSRPPASRNGIVRMLGAWRYKAAAVAVLIGGISTFFAMKLLKSEGAGRPGATTVAEVLPGTNKAMLTLADGSVIELDSTGAVTIPRQGSASISAAGGQLSYDANSIKAAPAFNTLRTPRGGQFKVILSDGTKVWMNAESSLTYPTTFSDDFREVELTGEAFFEVEKDAMRPFRVKASEAMVDVLGTSFNVMAYPEEKSVDATLVQGAVIVKGNGGAKRLLPGEQAVVAGGATPEVSEVDVEEVLAWKNGLFIFQDADLKSVMRQLARWYDVEIEYQGRPSDMKLNGAVYRNYSLSQVLTVLKATGLQFKIEARKLIIIT
ncbi:FecR family protein [Chitinophaga caseinilytica]|uniref:FecR family protein n=1 Tax=Chitinophaga caseinilytica TaxID=2267521 RepID=UPI003C2F7F85